MSHDILFTFVGNRDPYDTAREGEFGPILSHLLSRTYRRVYLFCTGPDYIERGRTVEKIAREETEAMKFSFVQLDLVSVIDYEEIFQKLRETVEKIERTLQNVEMSKTVLLDPGTPQMQTSWFLLVKSGIFDAHLVQGVPARFAGGSYRVREIDLSSAVFPDIVQKPKKEPGPDILFQSAPERFEEEPEDKWISSKGEKIFGNSPAFEQLLKTANQVARYSDVSVLLRGETGTGKGIFARYIHDHSERNDKPFIELNCSAINENLVESEFFGHKKGAFTGADKERLGKFVAADGGTVFLDEIGDLPLALQPKLLKVLEDKELTPVGGDKIQKVDIRIIAATHKDLEKLIEGGSFRRDLYMRLNQVRIDIPPLEERKEDIELLANAFIKKWNEQYSEERILSEGTLEYFRRYSWPGNVRELANAIQSMCAMCRSEVISADFLPQDIKAYFTEMETPPLRSELEIPDEGVDLDAILYNIEKQYFEKALKKADGNKEQAAHLIGRTGHAFRKALRERFDIG